MCVCTHRNTRAELLQTDRSNTLYKHQTTLHGRRGGLHILKVTELTIFTWQNKFLNNSIIQIASDISYIWSSKVGPLYILTWRWWWCHWWHNVRMFWFWFTLWWGLNMSKNHIWQRTRCRNWMRYRCRCNCLCLRWGSRIMRYMWCKSRD